MLSKVTAKLKLLKKKLWLNSPKDSPLLFSLHRILLAGIALFLFVLLIIIGKYFIFETPSTTHTIVFSQEGFTPQDITIKKGDTVIFRNESGNQMWPASNLHPSHGIYPEFDPKKSIENGVSWQFKFNKEGKWKYHDHLSPLSIGSIKVGRKINLLPLQQKTYEDCEKENSEGCWGELIKSTAEEKGIEEAYHIFTKAFNTNPSFAENCHGYTHTLGEVAYSNFSNKEDFPVTDQLAYCSYGFFHGFIEAMMHEQGNLAQAREMCDYIDKRLAGKTETLGACLHGIGHGVTDGVVENAYGNAWKIIEPGLKLCQSIATNEYEDKICATGVFNALAIMYTGSTYGLKVNKDDPFEICRQQKKDSYKHACFDDFKALIMHLQNNNFVKAARYIEGIQEDVFAQGAIDNLATYYVYYLLKDPDYKRPISECYSLQERLHADCISGLGAGFMTASTPGKEYVRALELCSNSEVLPQDQDACHSRVIRLIRLRYSLNEYRKICNGVSDLFQYYCTYYENQT